MRIRTAGSNWGHGIGLTLYEYPIIWRGTSLYDPITLQAGMTFAIETQHGTPGSHGVRIEEMVHVTENGCEIMSQWPVGEISEVPLDRVLKTRSPWIPSAPGGSHLHPVRSIRPGTAGAQGRLSVALAQMKAAGFSVSRYYWPDSGRGPS